MADRSSELKDDRAKALARIATLQRLRDQFKETNREKLAHAAEKLMEVEARLLHRDKDAETA